MPRVNEEPRKIVSCECSSKVFKGYFIVDRNKTIRKVKQERR